MNIWKITTIILLLVILILGLMIKSNIMEENKEYNINGFKITKGNFDSIIENLGSESGFNICSIKDNNCIIMIRNKGK